LTGSAASFLAQIVEIHACGVIAWYSAQDYSADGLQRDSILCDLFDGRPGIFLWIPCDSPRAALRFSISSRLFVSRHRISFPFFFHYLLTLPSPHLCLQHYFNEHVIRRTAMGSNSRIAKVLRAGIVFLLSADRCDLAAGKKRKIKIEIKLIEC
jgi:hypothetical protein